MHEMTRTGNPELPAGRPRSGELTAAESRLELVRADGSVGELVSRLAQEGRGLAEVELRRLRVEVREQARRAGRVAAAGYLAMDFLALASLALAVGVFLLLARWWDSYAAAAFATGGLLALVALALALVGRGLMRRTTDTTTSPRGEGH